MIFAGRLVLNLMISFVVGLIFMGFGVAIGYAVLFGGYIESISIDPYTGEVTGISTGELIGI